MTAAPRWLFREQCEVCEHWEWLLPIKFLPHFKQSDLWMCRRCEATVFEMLEKPTAWERYDQSFLDPEQVAAGSRGGAPISSGNRGIRRLIRRLAWWSR